MTPSFLSFVDELDKISAARPIPVLEKVLSRIPSSRLGGLFPQLPFGEVWRRKTLSDIVSREGIPEAVKTYRMALRGASRSSEMPLAERLKAYKAFKQTGEMPSVYRSAGREYKVRSGHPAAKPIGGEGTVTLTSYGPQQALEQAVKDPASKLEPFYLPGKTKPVTEGLFFWEGKGPSSFKSSPRGFSETGSPAKLTLEIPRSKVLTTGKHKELHPLGERIVPREELLRHATNIKIEKI